MTGPQGMGVLIPNVDVLSGGLDVVYEPVLDYRTAVSPSTANYPAGIAITDYHMTVIGGAFQPAGTPVESSIGEELARVQWTSGGGIFIWCRYTESTEDNNGSAAGLLNSPFSSDGTNRGNGCRMVASLINPSSPVALTVGGTPGTSSCDAPSVVTTAPNQRVIYLVGCTGSTTPTPPINTQQCSDVTNTSGTVGRIIAYSTLPGAYPDEGMIVPSRTFSGAGNTYMNVTAILLNGLEASPELPLIVSARLSASGANSHTMRTMPGALPGDVWCVLPYGVAQETSSNINGYLFAEYDPDLATSVRFGHPNHAEIAQDGFYGDDLESGNTSSGGLVLSLLLRNVRRAYPIKDWNPTGTDLSPTGTYPTFTIPDNPTPSVDGLGVDLIRWANLNMQPDQDDTPYSGTRGNGNPTGAYGLIHASSISAGVPKFGRNVVFKGTSGALNGGRAFQIVGEHLESPPSRMMPRPRYRTHQRFTTAATSHSPTAFSTAVGNVCFASCASAQPVTSISGGDWSIIASYAFGSSNLTIASCIATGTTITPPTWNFGTASVAWTFGLDAADAENSLSFTKTDLNNPGVSTISYAHSFDFSDVLEPTASILFLCRTGGSGTTQTGPNIEKSASNRVWSGPFLNSNSFNGMRAMVAVAMIDGTVTDVNQNTFWNARGSGTTAPSIALALGLVGSLYEF